MSQPARTQSTHSLAIAMTQSWSVASVTLGRRSGQAVMAVDSGEALRRPHRDYRHSKPEVFLFDSPDLTLQNLVFNFDFLNLDPSY